MWPMSPMQKTEPANRAGTHRAITGTPITRTFVEWQRASSQAFVPLHAHATRGGDFSGKLTSFQHAAASAIRIDASAHAVERTPELISAGGGGMLKFTLQEAGRSYLIQGGRELELTPGRLAVYDTSEPYTMVVDDDSSMLIVMLPYARLSAPARNLTAVALGENGGMSDVVAPLLAGLSRRIAQQDAAGGRQDAAGLAALCAHSVGLLDAMCRDQAERDLGSEAIADSALAAVRATIEAKLRDPSLTPATLAQAHFMSVRQLYTIFEPMGVPVATWIRTRRLEEARKEIQDPAHASVPVSHIGARWGFPEAAHFSRAFKTEFGQTPTQARQKMRAPR